MFGELSDPLRGWINLDGLSLLNSMSQSSSVCSALPGPPSGTPPSPFHHVTTTFHIYVTMLAFIRFLRLHIWSLKWKRVSNSTASYSHNSITFHFNFTSSIIPFPFSAALSSSLTNSFFGLSIFVKYHMVHHEGSLQGPHCSLLWPEWRRHSHGSLRDFEGSGDWCLTVRHVCYLHSDLWTKNLAPNVGLYEMTHHYCRNWHLISAGGGLVLFK